MIFAVKILILFGSCIVFAAYLSLFERKVIARVQMRLGPSYNGMFGVLQPIADAIKLFFKRGALEGHSSYAIFAVCLFMALSFISIILIPLSENLYIFNPKYGLLYIVFFQVIIKLSEIVIGIESKSKYGVIGGIRAYFQSVCEYLPFVLSIICIVFITRTFNIIEVVQFQKDVSFAILITPVAVIYFTTSLMLLNRIPFDFPEAESEIIAGNYVEYGGMLFGMIYLSEYLNLMFVSALISLLFLGGWNPIYDIAFASPCFWMILKTMLVMTLIIIIRSVLPRYKQSQVIRFSWLVFCPIIIIYIASYL